MSASDAVEKRIDEILDLYWRALLATKSPFAATTERWQVTRDQAEAILTECVRVLGGIVKDQPDPYTLTQGLGIQRARQQGLASDSIRAGTLLWRAAVPVLREILTAEGPAGYERLTDVLEALHEAISIRLYMGTMAHEHAGLASHAPVLSLDPPGVREHDKFKPVSRPENITTREWQVLECVSRGFSNRDIAKELALSEPTVKTHLRKVFRKLGATSRVDAINKVGLGSLLGQGHGIAEWCYGAECGGSCASS